MPSRPVLLHIPYLQVNPQRGDIEEILQLPSYPVDLVVISGNLVESAVPSQFDIARRVLLQIGDRLRLPPQRILITPGDSDVNFLACEAYFKQCEASEQTPQLPYWPKLQPFAQLFAQRYAASEDTRFQADQPYAIFPFPELRLVVAACNTTWSESHLQRRGSLGERQLAWFAERLLTYRRAGHRCVGLLGHPLGGSAPDSLTDEAALREQLGALLDLTLHPLSSPAALDWVEVRSALPTHPRRIRSALLREDRVRDRAIASIQDLLEEAGLGPGVDLEVASLALRRLAPLPGLDEEPARTFLAHLAELVQHAVDSAFQFAGVYEDLYHAYKHVGYALGTNHEPDEDGRYQEDQGLFGALTYFGARWPEPQRWIDWAKQRGGHAWTCAALAIPEALRGEVPERVDAAQQAIMAVLSRPSGAEAPPSSVDAAMQEEVAQRADTAVNDVEALIRGLLEYERTPAMDAVLARLADLEVTPEELSWKGPARARIADLLKTASDPVSLLCRIVSSAGATALAAQAAVALHERAPRAAVQVLRTEDGAEEIRLLLAEHLGRAAFPFLKALAEGASDEHVRRSAGIDLRSIRLRLALQRIGRRPQRRGVVSLAGQRVGLLEETPDGTRFSYDLLWLLQEDAAPISMTMPLRTEPYESLGLHPFFDNLLPEGWLLEVVSRRQKLAREDRFGLLLLACADCAGAVEIRPAPEDEP